MTSWLSHMNLDLDDMSPGEHYHPYEPPVFNEMVLLPSHREFIHACQNDVERLVCASKVADEDSAVLDSDPELLSQQSA